MAPLPIVIGAENPVLRTKTKKVPKITKEILKLIDDMQETMTIAKGAGIAAPQVGRTERVCIALIGGKMTALVNPEITWHGELTDVAEEGCLSLPDTWINVRRPTEIILKTQTTDGKNLELKLIGFDARVVQHEVDHLEGVLITDHREKVVM